MNHHEAKFLLRAYRPNGRDANDPVFADPLHQAAQDPGLSAWLEREQAFDSAVAAKLATIQPPAGLRDAILAGARASQPRRRWWTHPLWLAVAASVALLLSFTVRWRFASTPLPTARDLATFAIDDVAKTYATHLHSLALEGAQAQLANSVLPLPDHLALNFDELKQKGCRTVRVAGREVFEICFKREGHWYHLYAARVDDFAPGTAEVKSQLTTKGQFAATAWKDSRHVYALVAGAGTEALQHLL